MRRAFALIGLTTPSQTKNKMSLSWPVNKLGGYPCPSQLICKCLYGSPSGCTRGNISLKKKEERNKDKK